MSIERIHLHSNFKDELKPGGNPILLRALLLVSFVILILAWVNYINLSITKSMELMKEIGLRKMVGASRKQLFMLLSKETIKLVLIAFLVTLPVSYFLLKNWLQGYAFRIEITPWLFVIPAFVVVCITFFTVGFQTIKTALANPVKALRYE